jgi:hypothetical protein
MATLEWLLATDTREHDQMLVIYRKRVEWLEGFEWSRTEAETHELLGLKSLIAFMEG